MKRTLIILSFITFTATAFAQNTTPDTLGVSRITVNKDPRLDLLAKAEAEINGLASKFTKGYRLLVLKSDDRDYSMKVRAYLLQSFPEQKVIMTYQAPFIKLKFGDFIEKEEAEKYRDMIMKGRVVTGNIYVVADTVEVKPDKNKEEEEQ